MNNVTDNIKANTSNNKDLLSPSERLRYDPTYTYDQYLKDIPNPKFHRTKEEKTLSFQFLLDNSDMIDLLEEKIYNNGKAFEKNYDTLCTIKSISESLSAFYALKEFCHGTPGGELYFEDNWECCHNTRNPCFSFGEVLKEKLEFLLKNKDLLVDRDTKIKTLRPDLFSFLKNNCPILQKDIYQHFNLFLKYSIQQEIRTLASEGIIKRTKYKGTYTIELI